MTTTGTTSSRINEVRPGAKPGRTARFVLVHRPRWDAENEVTYDSLEIQVHISGAGVAPFGGDSFMTVCDTLADAIDQAAIYGAEVQV